MTTFYQPINNAETTVSVAYTAGDGTLTVEDGSVFGSPSGIAPLRVSLATPGGVQKSILRIIGRSGNDLTVDTAIEGTTDVNLDIGDIVEVRVTAGTLSDVHDAINEIESITGDMIIGGNVIDATVGSILFVGDGLLLSENNGSLYWDAVNNYMGIGTTTPKTFVDIRGGLGVLRGITDVGLLENSIDLITNMTAVFQIDADTYNGMAFISAGDNSHGFWHQFMKTRSMDGSTNSPVINNDEIARLNFYADNGTFFVNGAAIAIEVDGGISPAHVPSRIVFYTSLNTGVLSERMRITGDGRIIIGTPTSSPVDAQIGPGKISFYLDEVANKLMIRVKYTDGSTLKTGEIALT